MKTKKIFLFIFVISLLVRLIYVIPLSPEHLASDSCDWNDLAARILAGKDFGASWRAPIYVFFLVFVYGIFGYSVLAVRIVQAIVSAFNAVLIVITGKKIFNRKIGFLSGLIFAFYPYFIFFTGDILAETLYTFFISLSVFTLLLNFEKDSLKTRIFSGVSLGLTSLTKGSFPPFFAFVFLWILIRNRESFFQKIKTAVGIFVVTFLTIIPWSIRNCLYYNHFTLVSTGGASFWVSNNPASARLETVPAQDIKGDYWDQDFLHWPAERMKEIEKLGRIEADKQFKREAWAFILSSPGNYLKLMRMRLFHFWRLWPKIAPKRNKLVAKCTSGWILPFGWLGILLSFKRYWRKTVILIFLFATFSFVHMMFFSAVRYRVPIDPFIIIFASYTVFRLGEKLGIRLCAESTE
ncbi:MAG: glycosyltransferase family 39 protein [bacterium]